jgi:hypothetical protein
MRLQFRLARFTRSLTFQTLSLDTNFYNTIFNLLPPAPPQPKRTYTATNGVKVVMLSTASCDITKLVSSNEITFGATTNAASATFASDLIRDQSFDKIVSALKELYIWGANGGSISQTCRYCMNFINGPNNYCNWILVPNPYFDPDVDKCSRFQSVSTDTRKYDIHYVR